MISWKIAKEIFKDMVTDGKSARTIIQEKGLIQVSDSDEIASIISMIIGDHPDEAKKYQAGATKLFDYFVGQVMKETRGRANPHLVKKLLHEKLSSF